MKCGLYEINNHMLIFICSLLQSYRPRRHVKFGKDNTGVCQLLLSATATFSFSVSYLLCYIFNISTLFLKFFAYFSLFRIDHIDTCLSVSAEGVTARVVFKKGLKNAFVCVFAIVIQLSDANQHLKVS
jgi:hypothetical protein